jgi:eukaryotic translation initiation factor 2C
LRSNPRPTPVGDQDVGLPNEEIIALSDMVFNALVNWVMYRGGNTPTFPKQIIVFRDGLSEGQFEMCRTREFPRIKEGIDNMIKRAKEKHDWTLEVPKIMLICTVKCHHTRFLRDGNNRNDNDIFDRNQNPLPGCLVENTVTIGNNNDIYRYSHKAIQGTSKSTHYVVLENKMQASMQDIA